MVNIDDSFYLWSVNTLSACRAILGCYLADFIYPHHVEKGLLLPNLAAFLLFDLVMVV